MSLGVVCQWEGRWDEALRTTRGSDEALKIGDTVGARWPASTSPRSYRSGRWAEAEAAARTLPFWKASQYRYYLAACLSLLGRVSCAAAGPRKR